MVPDFVRLGITAAIPLPNQGFPARSLAATAGYFRANSEPPRLNSKTPTGLPTCKCANMQLCIRTRVQTQPRFPRPRECAACEISGGRSHQSGIGRGDRGFRLISSALRW